MQTLSVTAARTRFSQLLNLAFRRDRRILIEKQGIPIAGIVSAEDLERLNTLDKQWDESFAFLDSIAERFSDVPADELEREINRAVQASREDSPHAST